jgi:hypothetical protein
MTGGEGWQPRQNNWPSLGKTMMTALVGPVQTDTAPGNRVGVPGMWADRDANLRTNTSGLCGRARCMGELEPVGFRPGSVGQQVGDGHFVCDAPPGKNPSASAPGPKEQWRARRALEPNLVPLTGPGSLAGPTRPSERPGIPAPQNDSSLPSANRRCGGPEDIPLPVAKHRRGHRGGPMTWSVRLGSKLRGSGESRNGRPGHVKGLGATVILRI